MAVDKRMEPVVMADIANRVGDQEVVVDIENPDSVSIETEDGGMIIDFDPDPSVDDAPFDSNLYEYLAEDCNQIVQAVARVQHRAQSA